MGNIKLSKAAIQMREQVDDSFPGRDRKSDGWLGDFRHSTRKSDHNPDADGWVRAIDISADLGSKGQMAYLADQIRSVARKDGRISYVIFNGRIASPRLGWRWRGYNGASSHQHHCHVSFKKTADNDGRFFQIPMLGGHE
jgi:hypothetical protein